MPSTNDTPSKRRDGPSRKAGVGPGVLYPERQPPGFTLDRFYPRDSLADIVEHYWTVSWSLPAGQRREQETLPDPCSHASFEVGGSELVAPMRGRFHRELVGTRAVYAVKFRPAGLHALIGCPQAPLVNTRPKLDVLFPSLAVAEVEARILAGQTPAAFAANMDAFLASLDPRISEQARGVNHLVERVLKRDPDDRIETVEKMAALAGCSVRSLQRRFATLVGLSPKWVVQRARLHNALDVLAEHGDDLAGAAYTLGYADQAHFARDFRAVVGLPPSAYVTSRRLRS